MAMTACGGGTDTNTPLSSAEEPIVKPDDCHFKDVVAARLEAVGMRDLAGERLEISESTASG